MKDNTSSGFTWLLAMFSIDGSDNFKAQFIGPGVHQLRQSGTSVHLSRLPRRGPPQFASDTSCPDCGGRHQLNVSEFMMTRGIREEVPHAGSVRLSQKSGKRRKRAKNGAREEEGLGRRSHILGPGLSRSCTVGREVVDITCMTCVRQTRLNQA